MAGNQTGPAPSGAAGTARQARDEMTQVGRNAQQAGGAVGHQAMDEGRQVATEASRQARNMLGQASDQLRDQAQTQQHRVADGLRGLGQQLRSMADKAEQPGMAGDVVGRAADAAQRAAGWLDQRDPGTVLDEVRDYARQHPGTFLAGLTLAGVVVGRLARNMGSTDGAGGNRPTGSAPAAGMRGPGTPGAWEPDTETPLTGDGRSGGFGGRPDQGVER